eukprot:Awhi_evm1s5988
MCETEKQNQQLDSNFFKNFDKIQQLLETFPNKEEDEVTYYKNEKIRDQMFDLVVSSVPTTSDMVLLQKELAQVQLGYERNEIYLPKLRDIKADLKSIENYFKHILTFELWGTPQNALKNIADKTKNKTMK